MTLLFSDDRFLRHETGGHPECSERLESIARRLQSSGLESQLPRGETRAATDEELARVHPGPYVSYVKRIADNGGGHLDADTLVAPQSFDVARLAAGTACAAVDAVLTGDERTAMCLVRPPGHHALPERGMGFCLFNNVAVAARHALEAHGLGRVLIVDWDVHHGNGTQDVFYESPQVYFFSAHRSPFYPYTGYADETGMGYGLGTTFNLPLEYGVSRREYIERFHTMLADVAARCEPDLILLSAGFDAHAADPIGSLGLETEDFGALTQLVLDAAAQYCGGRLVSLLEGGYHLEALAESVACHLERLRDAGLK